MDGNDAVGIYRAALEAREYVRENGPMLLVLNTYRHMGHSKSDANVYRTKQEIEEWKKRCPIKRMREQLVSEGRVHGRGAGRHGRAGRGGRPGGGAICRVQPESPDRRSREGRLQVREITYADAIREAMCEEMRADPRVFLLGEDIGIYGGAFGVTKGMVQEFGEERSATRRCPSTPSPARRPGPP